MVNDLIPFKPNADVTLTATMQAAEPADRLEAGVRIGDRTATLHGKGARSWFYDKRWRLTDPEPIKSLDICYSKACGGRIIGHPDGDVDPKNPIGAGIIHPDFTPRHLEFPTPQIE